MHNLSAFDSTARSTTDRPLAGTGAPATAFRSRPTSDSSPDVASDARILRKVLGEMAARLPAEELLDSLAAFIAAAVGEGSVVWPAVGDPRLDGRPVVSHPDPAVRLSVRRALAGSRGPVPEQRRAPGTPSGAAARLHADLLRAAGGAMVTPVRRHGRLLGHIAGFSTTSREYGRGPRRLLDRLAHASGAALGQLAAEVAGPADPVPTPAVPHRDQSEPHPPRAAASDRSEVAALLPRQGSAGALEDGLDQLVDQDRRSLAQVIADEPIQRIVSGLLTLEHLRNRLDDNARQVVDDVTAQLEDSLSWLRQLILVALTPPDLADGLGRALGALARSIFAGTRTRVTVTGPNHVPLGPAAMETAYRIFREALTNVRRHAAAESVTLRIDVHHSHVVLSLTDSGIGKDGLGQDVATRGLAAMRARAESIGGLLSIVSAPGNGTTVTLSLAAQPPQDGRRFPEPTGRRTRSIIVCDDQQDLREAIRLVLTDIPRFRVVAEAGDGPSGLDEIRRHKPDLIILDVTMPGGGPDLARAAKDASPTSHIVVFSGRDDSATRDAMLAAGADQYVLKSGRLRLLLDALDNAG